MAPWGNNGGAIGPVSATILGLTTVRLRVRLRVRTADLMALVDGCKAIIGDFGSDAGLLGLHRRDLLLGLV